jgi:class 3 adenylate cyclase
MAAVHCSQCGAENPDGFRFCGSCGAPLAAAPEAERRERRVISVLFADLVGFTRRSEQLDVEDVEGFLAPYQALLAHCVERTGGAVAKFTGDGVMALFGGLVAHEDDAERAVRCALLIRDGLADADDQSGEERLRVRVGVTTGEALVSIHGSASVDAVGDVVNTAARLESAAPVDGVLVDDWTFRATNRAIRYEPSPPVVARGKTDMVQVWLATEPRSIVPEQQRDRLPLVGRDAEATILREALDRSRQEPSTQLISVIGEPGIGKSRLVEELYDHVGQIPDLVTWRRGRTLSYGDSIAFWALGEMVKAQAGILESDLASVAEQKLAEAANAVIVDAHDAEWVARHLRRLVGLEASPGSGDGGRVEAFAAWRRFVEALAENGPTVLIFEDIHWADDALLDFIDLVADRAGAVPLLIVCTARPELFERRERWAGGKSNALTISLRPLSDDDTARLVGGLLDQSALPAEVQGALLERAEGNPLYAQEYVRMLQDRALLVRDGDGWRLSGDIVDLPESLQGIIAARLDTLSPEEKTLIQDAAVVGKTAWLGAVCALSERSLWGADEALHGLERKQLLQRVRRSSIQGETEFQFGHALTRDVAYSQIRRADRAAKHIAAATWIEQLGRGREDKAELLAEHYGQALALREAMGQDTAALAPQALAALTEAAEQAAAMYAHEAAARHFRAALALTPADDVEHRATLLLGIAIAVRNADGPDQDEALERAVDAQIAAESWEGAAEAERQLGHRNAEMGSGEAADAHFARAAAYAAKAPPGQIMLNIAANQAYRLTISGRPAEALALTDGMMPIAESAGLEVGHALLSLYRGYAKFELGDLDGLEDVRRSAATMEHHAYPSTTVAYGNFADIVRSLGDMRAADQAYTAAAAWANRFGQPRYAVWITTEQAYQAYHAAEWSTTDHMLGELADAADSAFASMVRIVQGHIQLARGAANAALDGARIVIRTGVERSDDPEMCYGLSLEAMAREAQDDRAGALAACDRFLALWHETGGLTTRALELCELATVLVRADRHDGIGEAAALLMPECRWRTALEHLAERRYADAAALYGEIGSRPLAADAHLLAAEASSGEESAHHVRAVLDFAEQTGAVAYQRAAEQLRA